MESSESYEYDSDNIRNGNYILSHENAGETIPFLSSVVHPTETHIDNEKNDEGRQKSRNDNNIYSAYDPANDRIDDAYIYYDVYRCLFPFHDSRLSEPQKKCMNYTFLIILLGIFILGSAILIVSLIKLKMSTPN